MRYKVELTIDLNENWTGENPNDWDWQTLLDVGNGMELDEVRIWEHPSDMEFTGLDDDPSGGDIG